MALIKRGDVNRPLTINEMDDNLDYLEQLSSGSGRLYSVYSANITQSGVSAPNANVFENTLGGSVIWSRVGEGRYMATCSGKFTLGRTQFFFSYSGDTNVAHGRKFFFTANGIGNHSGTANSILFDTYSAGDSGFRDGLVGGEDDDFISLEIRVYGQ